MAKRFRFRLETVRRLRRQAMDEQRRMVAGAVQSVNAVQSEIGQREADLRDGAAASRYQQQGKVLDVAEARTRQAYRTWLKRKLAERREELDGRKLVLAQERKRLARASRQLKVLDNLRERQWRKHQGNDRRAEQAAYDESAAVRFVRSSKGRARPG